MSLLGCMYGFYGVLPFYPIIICGGLVLLFLTGGILVLLPLTAPQLNFEKIFGVRLPPTLVGIHDFLTDGTKYMLDLCLHVVRGE